MKEGRLRPLLRGRNEGRETRKGVKKGRKKGRALRKEGGKEGHSGREGRMFMQEGKKDVKERKGVN